MKKYTLSASLSREDEKELFTTRKVNTTTDDIPSTTSSSIYSNQRRGVINRSQTQLQANQSTKQVQIIEELKEEEEENIPNKPSSNTRPIGIKTKTTSTTTTVEPSSTNSATIENSISDGSVVSSVAASGSLSSNPSSVASSPMVSSSVESSTSSPPNSNGKKKKFTFGGLIKRKQHSDDASSPTANVANSPNILDESSPTSTTNFESNSLPKRPQIISVNDGSDFRKKLQDRKKNVGGTGIKIVKQNDVQLGTTSPQQNTFQEE